MTSKLKAAPSLKQTGQFLSAAYKKLQQEQSAKFAIVLVGILFIAALAYISLSYNWPKFSRAEVFFAECVREMLEADNLVTPLYHGTAFFDKPILAYWLITASYKACGISHFASRIPSIMAALLTVAITGLSAKHLFGPRAGTLAACALASSVMFMSFAALCMSDMLLVLFDSCTLVCLYLALESEKRRSILFYLASLSMGLAFITKGPVGIALPAVAYAAYLSLTRQWHKISLLKHALPGVLILLGCGVPWFASAFRQNGLSCLSYFFIHENLERFAGSTYDTHKPFWFMLSSFFAGMLPWSVFIPFVAFDSYKKLKAENELKQANTGRSANQPDRSPDSVKSETNKQLYLYLWIAVVLGFFSCSRGKIDYYSLPAYPAAAILMGSYLSSQADKNGKVLKVISWIFSGALLPASIASFFIIPQLLSQQSAGNAVDAALACAIPVIMLVSALLMILSSFRQDFRKSVKMIFVTVSLFAIAFSWQLYPWISSKQAVLKYMPAISELPEYGQIGVYTNLQNWIDEISFQTGKEARKIESIRAAEHFILGRKTKALLLIQEKDFEQMSPQAKANCKVLESNPFIPRSLNPVYLAGKGRKLGEISQLLLVSKTP